MSIARDISRGLKHLERDLGKPSFHWNGADYPCTETTATGRKEQGIGGMGLDADLVLFARADLFASIEARPQSGKRLTHRSKVYRITEVAVLPGEAVLKIVCVSAVRNLQRE